MARHVTTATRIASGSTLANRAALEGTSPSVEAMTLDALVAEASEVELLVQSVVYHSANWGSSMQSHTKFESQDLPRAKKREFLRELSQSEESKRRNE
jgi:hypothetical protein